MKKPFKWNEPSETEIEDAILDYLRYQVGVFAFKVKIKATFDAGGGYYRKLPKHVLPGTPDIIACIDVNGIGVFAGMEVKTPTGRQSKEQVDFQDKLQDRANGFYFILRSVKDAEEAVKFVRDKTTASHKQLVLS